MSLNALLRDRKLPVRWMGYDRATTDELLRAVEEALTALAEERDELRGRLAEAERELERFGGEMEAVQGRLAAFLRGRRDGSSP